MSVETWAKALTAMEAKVGVTFEDLNLWYADVTALPDDKQDLDITPYLKDKRKAKPEDILAAACDALSLPWQQHPVWRMWEALQKARQYMEDNIGCDCRHDADLCEYCDARRDIVTVAAAKGGGSGGV